MEKIIFFGTPNFSIPTLSKLIDSKYEIVSVFTKPAKKSNRGQKVLKSAIHKFAEKFKLDIKTPENIKSEINFIKNSKIDLGIVVAYGQIIPESILNSCKYGFINIHASLLPKYRGAAPIQRSLINLEKFTGISFMKMNHKLDSGPVFNKYQIKIDEKDNNETLSSKLSQLGSDKILQNIENIFLKKAKFEEQSHEEATYANKIKKKEGKIDWKESAKKIIGKIRGLSPNPGAWFTFENERYKILDAELSSLNGEAGSVLDKNFTVGCGINSITISVIQRQGKNPQKTKEFLLGSKIKKGIYLKS